MPQTVLETFQLSKRFCRRRQHSLRYAASDIWRELTLRPARTALRPGEFWALRDVNLRIEAGEVLGIIGHNGAGKSTLISLLAGAILPTRGRIDSQARRIVVMDQNGGLNGQETGAENIATQLTLHGCRRGRLQAEIDAVAEFAGLGEFLQAPVGTYSLGMRLRLAFSIYTRLKPDLFIVDEAIGGGDLQFRQRFQAYLQRYVEGGGSILLCSHELFLVQTLCRRSILLEAGQVRHSGDTVEVIHAYQESLRLRPEPITMRSGDRPGSAPDGSTAHPIEVIALTLRAEDGGPARPGLGAVIEVSLESERAFAELACTLEIGCGEQTALASLIGGIGSEPLRVQAGRDSIRCKIDTLPLSPGAYDLRVVLADPRSSLVLGRRGYEDPPVRVEVAAFADPVNNLRAYRRNLLYLPSRWECADGAAPRHDASTPRG